MPTPGRDGTTSLLLAVAVWCIQRLCSPPTLPSTYATKRPSGERAGSPALPVVVKRVTVQFSKENGAALVLAAVALSGAGGGNNTAMAMATLTTRTAASDTPRRWRLTRSTTSCVSDDGGAGGETGEDCGGALIGPLPVRGGGAAVAANARANRLKSARSSDADWHRSARSFSSAFKIVSSRRSGSS